MKENGRYFVLGLVVALLIGGIVGSAVIEEVSDDLDRMEYCADERWGEENYSIVADRYISIEHNGERFEYSELVKNCSVATDGGEGP